MSEWKEYKLGDIADVVSERVSISKATLDNYISTENMINDFGGVTKAEKLPIATSVNSFNQNDTLFSNIRTYFKKVWLSKFNGTVSPDVLVFRARENKCISAHLYYSLCNPDFTEYSVLTSKGAKMPRGDKDALLNFIISLPSLPEQTGIASILSSLDDKIELLHRQNATLEKMAETLFRQWFVEEAKEEWEEKSLGELLTITSSKRIFYSEYVSSGIPFYRSKEIIELRNTGSTASELYISNERFDEIDSKFGSPKEGDILMTSVGTLGVAYRVKANDKFYFKDGNLTWFKDFKGLPSSIIYLWLISKIGQEELSAITIGSTQQALTIEGLKSISFKIPPKEIVSTCEKQFDDIISKIDSNQTQIRTLTALRDTLLPKLISGEVRVNL
ncbi:MAG: restriction endonuclease subunit S [Flammeovirgaceae bacterium]|jgi:type I restriction enzyme S subunit|nr:restriction endonuclease subunit S [Flammeovirgaceae bacterium]